MPVITHQAMLFILAFVLILSVMMASTYNIVTGMVADTYRYENVIKKANEKIRLIAISTSDKLYFGIRNIAMSSITIRKLGVLDENGLNHELVRDLELKPGEARIEVREGRYNGTLYAVTARGNIFSVSIINYSAISKRFVIPISSLLPACVYRESQLAYDVSYGEDYIYVVNMCTYAYVFGFIVVDDPYTDDSIYVEFGPYNVAQLFKRQEIPYTAYWYQAKGDISLEAKFNFTIKSYRGHPCYYVQIALDARRTDDKNGIIVHGCMGILWRTISSTISGISVRKTEIYDYKCGRYGCARNFLGTIVIPSALDAKTLVAEISKEFPQGTYTTKAPSGSQVYIALLRCFSVESSHENMIKTTFKNPYYTVHLPEPFDISTRLIFPLEISFVYIRLNIDPKIIIMSLLGTI